MHSNPLLLPIVQLGLLSAAQMHQTPLKIQHAIISARGSSFPKCSRYAATTLHHVPARTSADTLAPTPICPAKQPSPCTYRKPQAAPILPNAAAVSAPSHHRTASLQQLIANKHVSAPVPFPFGTSSSPAYRVFLP